MLIYADVHSLFTWVWRLKLLFIIGLMSEVLSRSLCSSECVGRETLDAKELFKPEIRNCNSQSQKLNLSTHLREGKRRKKVLFSSQCY